MFKIFNESWGRGTIPSEPTVVLVPGAQVPVAPSINSSIAGLCSKGVAVQREGLKGSEWPMKDSASLEPGLYTTQRRSTKIF